MMTPAKTGIALRSSTASLSLGSTAGSVRSLAILSAAMTAQPAAEAANRRGSSSSYGMGPVGAALVSGPRRLRNMECDPVASRCHSRTRANVCEDDGQLCMMSGCHGQCRMTRSQRTCADRARARGARGNPHPGWLAVHFPTCIGRARSHARGLATVENVQRIIKVEYIPSRYSWDPLVLLGAWDHPSWDRGCVLMIWT